MDEEMRKMREVYMKFENEIKGFELQEMSRLSRTLEHDRVSQAGGSEMTAVISEMESTKKYGYHFQMRVSIYIRGGAKSVKSNPNYKSELESIKKYGEYAYIFRFGCQLISVAWQNPPNLLTGFTLRSSQKPTSKLC